MKAINIVKAIAEGLAMLIPVIRQRRQARLREAQQGAASAPEGEAGEGRISAAEAKARAHKVKLRGDDDRE